VVTIPGRCCEDPFVITGLGVGGAERLVTGLADHYVATGQEVIFGRYIVHNNAGDRIVNIAVYEGGDVRDYLMTEVRY